MRASIFVLALFFWSATTCPAADALNCVVFVPQYPSEITVEKTQKFFDASVRTLPQKSLFLVYDAGSKQKLCEFVISGSGAGSVRAANKALMPVWQHFERSKAGQRTDLTDQLDVPSLVNTIASIVFDNKRPLSRVVLIGSPYHQSGDKATSFGPKQIPSSEHLASSPARTPFGCNREGRKPLQNVTFDWLLPENLPAQELEVVATWWARWAALQGGRISTVVGDASIVADRLAANVVDEPYKNGEVRKGGSVTILEVSKLPEPAPAPAKSAFEAAVDTGKPTGVSVAPPAAEQVAAAAAALPTPRLGFINVSAVFSSVDGAADVDLYIRPNARSDELRFDLPAIPGARYLRDIRSSKGNALDTASCEVVELSEADPRDLTCWVNLYDNTDAPVEGIVRVQTAARTFDIPFKLNGVSDQAKGRERREGNPAWVKIDIAGGAAVAGLDARTAR